MKSTTSFLVLAAALLAPAAVFADPAFSYSPRYVVGQTYEVWVDFGIMDPVPSDPITLAYGPADSTQPSAYTDIGLAGRVPNTGSATRRGANWTVGAGASGDQIQALTKPGATWRLAMYTTPAAPAAAAAGDKQNFQVAIRASEIVPAGSAGESSVIAPPIATAVPAPGPGVSAATTMPTRTASVSASASASSSANPGAAASSGPSVVGASSDAKIAPAGVGRAVAGLAVAGGIAALGAM
ncbi:hypothetical protein HDU86_003420 [Geranomyces michiganensis]|nr:hypothetical protein HDU86_003420 [Geranomyces michiganensis]